MKPSRKSLHSASSLTTLNLATGLAGALALTSGALAQTSDAPYAVDGATVETHQTTASGVTLNMDAGLSAVVLGRTTAASGKTITNAGTLTATVDVVQIQQGSGNTIINESTGTISSNLSAVAVGSTTTGTTITNGGRLSGAGSDATIDMQGTTAGITNTGIIENTGAGAAVLLQTAFDGASITNSGTITTLGAHAIRLVATIGGTQSGSVVNTSTGRINAGGGSGILASGVAENGSVTNAGTLTADYNGIDVSESLFQAPVRMTTEAADADIAPPVLNSGTITNSGTINAGVAGIVVNGSNANIISNLEGATINAGLADENADGPGFPMNSASGILVNGSNSGTVTNAGAITTNYDGIEIGGDNIGTVQNTVTGSVTSFVPAVAVWGDNSGLIENAGKLTSARIAGVYVTGTNSKDITNTATGQIVAASGNGISVLGRTTIRLDTVEVEPASDLIAANSGAITNAGSIKAGASGISVGSVSFMVGGAVEALDLSPSTLANAGTITNATGASIEAGAYGIVANAENSGTITNAGNIKAGASGIMVGTVAPVVDSATFDVETDTVETRVGNSGTVENATGALIEAAQSGILVAGDNAAGATVLNTGTIKADSGIAILGDNAGTVRNTGAIEATTVGIEAASNSGVIEASAGSSIASKDAGIVVIGDSNSLTNAGSITAVSAGVRVGGNAVTLTNSGDISATQGTGVRVDGNAKDVANTGTISGTAGIEVLGDVTGSLTNSGTITATVADGVNVSGSVSGSVTNSGDITAAGYGVSLAKDLSGNLTNSGTIKAQKVGVLVSGSVGGDLTNSGTISGKTGGVVVEGDVGAISNSGTITSAEAVALGVTGKAKSFDNSGKIAGVNGVALLGEVSGSVANSGTIEADNTGMFFVVAADVTNSGTIKAADGAGMSFLAAEGDVVNSGTIQATGGPGMTFLAAEGDVTNSGTIQATGGDGIAFWGAADVTNSGTISASGTGIDALSAQSITNSGTISGTTAGVAVKGDIEGAFSNSGTISALNNGATPAPVAVAVEVAGNVKSVTNSGTLSGTSGILVGGSVGGAVTNSGTITAIAPASDRQTLVEEAIPDPIGLGVSGSIEGDLSNSGSITATGGVAVQVGGNTKAIANSGTISGTTGILVRGSVTGDVTNTKTITATVAEGVHVRGSVTGSINNSGDITAAGAGVVLEKALTGNLTNSGTITTKDVGVAVLGNVGGDVTNTGTISSENIGLAVVGGVQGAIRNSGTITGAESLGLFVLGDAKSIDNSGKITGANGVAAIGSVSGNVTNSGTIEVTGSGLILMSVAEVINSGTISASETGIEVGSAQSVINSGTITASGENAHGIYTNGNAVVMNRGTVSANGTDSAAIVLNGDSQTLISSGSITSDNLAIASNGDDRVIFAAPSASSGTVGAVTGGIASSGAGSVLYFGAAHDVTATSDLLASKAANFSMTSSASISNFGAVFLAGSTNLTGVSQFNASAILAGAKLSANGTLEFSGSAGMPAGITLPTTPKASDVQLYNAGTLGGNGSIRLRSSGGGLGTMLNTGTIAPGNSIGHLSFDGNVVHSGSLELELRPVTSGAPVAGVDNDLISIKSGVAGQTANFTFASGSTLNFVVDGDNAEALVGAKYSFVSADSTAKIVIEGQPVSEIQLLEADDNLAGYKFYVVSDETNMSDLRSLYAVAARDGALDRYAETTSQREAGHFISGTTSPALTEIVTNLSLIPNTADLNLALERLSGEIYPSLVSLEQDRASDLMKNVASNLRPTNVAAAAEVSGKPVWSTFGEMTGSKGEYDDGNVAELDRSYYGALAGVDCKVSSRLNVGGFVNVADGKVDNHHPDRADFTAFDVGLYGRYNREGDYYYASLSYGVGEYDVTRQAAVAHVTALSSQDNVVTKADADSTQFTALLEKGYTFKLGDRNYLQPYASFQFSQVSFDSLTEKNGGALNLGVKFHDYNSALGSLGVAWQYDFNGVFGTRVQAGWSHEFNDEAGAVDATFAGTSGSYHMKGLELGDDRFNFGLGLDAQVSDRLLTYVRGDYTVSDGKSAVSGQAGVRYSW